VLGAAALGEAAEHLVGLGGPQPQRGGVLDQLVVVAGDEFPVDGLFLEDLFQPGPGGLVGVGGVELGRHVRNFRSAIVACRRVRGVGVAGAISPRSAQCQMAPRPMIPPCRRKWT
jgi:hypothetical protein